jgi:hypothetical protein
VRIARRLPSLKAPLASLIETAATVLRTGEGETVHVPNGLLLTSIVTVHTPAAGGT